jgi:hypothetical protein
MNGAQNSRDPAIVDGKNTAHFLRPVRPPSLMKREGSFSELELSADHSSAGQISPEKSDSTYSSIIEDQSPFSAYKSPEILANQSHASGKSSPFEQLAATSNNPQEPARQTSETFEFSIDSTDALPLESNAPVNHWYLEMLSSPDFQNGCAALIMVGVLAIVLSTCIPGVLGVVASDVLMVGGVIGATVGISGLAASALHGFFRPSAEPRHHTGSNEPTFGSAQLNA